MPYKDPEKGKQNKKEYATKNKEKINTYHREYYKTDPSKYVKTRAEYYLENKEEYARRSSEWHSKPENKFKKRQNKLSAEEFKQMKINQSNLCAIGNEPLPSEDRHIQIDHDHETGMIRGLACRAHNVGLGMFGDSYELLEKAAQYIINNKVRYLNAQT